VTVQIRKRYRTYSRPIADVFYFVCILLAKPANADIPVLLLICKRADVEIGFQVRDINPVILSVMLILMRLCCLKCITLSRCDVVCGLCAELGDDFLLLDFDMVV
jgi:hypothetical protein